MFASKDQFFTRSSAGYQLTRSLRFRASASAYLNRTFGSGNTQKWTWSCWIKRGALGSRIGLFSTNGTVDYFENEYELEGEGSEEHIESLLDLIEEWGFDGYHGFVE